ncbi:hypothetical protein D3C74_286290 [compost metagenome]
MIDEIFGGQFVSFFPGEILEHGYRYAGAISEPVHEFLFGQLVKHQRKLIKQRGEPHDIHFRIVPEPLFHRFIDKSIGMGLLHIKWNFMRLIAPVVGDVVVHLHRVPLNVGEERNRIFVPRHRIVDNHRIVLLTYPPVGRGQHLTGRSIDHLPIPIRIV